MAVNRSPIIAASTTDAIFSTPQDEELRILLLEAFRTFDVNNRWNTGIEEDVAGIRHTFDSLKAALEELTNAETE